MSTRPFFIAFIPVCFIVSVLLLPGCVPPVSGSLPVGGNESTVSVTVTNGSGTDGTGSRRIVSDGNVQIVKVTARFTNGSSAGTDVSLSRAAGFRGSMSVSSGLVTFSAEAKNSEGGTTYYSGWSTIMITGDGQSVTITMVPSLNNGLTGEWLFSGGSAADTSGKGLDGSFSGDIYAYQAYYDRLNGSLNACIFDGYSGAFNVPGQASQYAAVTNTFTISAWAKPYAAIALNGEVNNTVVGTAAGQRYLIAPQHGTSVYGDGHAAMGISCGTNGISGLRACSRLHARASHVVRIAFRLDAHRGGLHQ